MKIKENNRKTGNLGESIAVKYLKSKGFSVVERNYWRKWGEIDIVARRTSTDSLSLINKGFTTNISRETQKVVHFVEVKSVSYETRSLLDWVVTHETWRPEELVHAFKLNQIRKAIESWVLENNWQGSIQIDVIAIRMVPRERYAVVKYIPNVIIE